MLGRLIEGLKIIHAEDPDARVWADDNMMVLTVDLPRFSLRQEERLNSLGFEFILGWGQITFDLGE